MKARYYALILAVLVILGGAAYYASAAMMTGTQTGQTGSYGTGSTYGTGSGYQTSPFPSDGGSGQTNPPPASNQPSTYHVGISNFAFSPQTLTIKQGDTVVWTNSDAASHTVTSDTNAFASSTLSTGSTFQYTFQNAGTYTYHCAVHPGMTGTIIVTQ